MINSSKDSDVLALAKTVLVHEGAALSRLSYHLDDSFPKSLKLILSCSGRVILCGIGKSALVAQKLVGTLNSTGTSTFFLHAADALHGDLGMVGKDDILMLFSKSGETAEIKALLPLVRLKGNKIISFVSERASYLAQHADVSIYLPMDRESDAHDLVPTTSSTLQMAIGHALAICLMEARSFTPEDFAVSHPGGTLGKQLYLRVRDLTDTKLAPQVSPSAGLRKVIVEISSKRLGATCVVDENRNVLGIITDGDLRRMLEAKSNLESVSAAQLMSPNPKTIDALAMATEALLVMRSNSITQLVVISEGKYLGLVHLHEILKEGIV